LSIQYADVGPNLNVNLSNIQEFMKKYIFVLDAIKLLAMLADGKRVEGVLYMDEYGKPTFKPYYRKTPKCHHKDKLVHQLENGWVKESTEKYKVFVSVYKKLGLVRIMDIIDREAKEAKGALFDKELIEGI
jgi:hypothetical protein